MCTNFHSTRVNYLSLTYTRKAMGGLGCGDHTGLSSDTFCYLIDHRARVLLHPELIAAASAGRPIGGIMKEISVSDNLDLCL